MLQARAAQWCRDAAILSIAVREAGRPGLPHRPAAGWSSSRRAVEQWRGVSTPLSP